MAYPTRYTRQYDFQTYQSANPTRPLPGDKVNVDLNYVVSSIDEIVDYLEGIGRSDGALANASVGFDQLDAAVKAAIGFNITISSESPSGGSDGDIWFQV